MMNDIISCTLYQESIALDGLSPHSTTSISGMIQIHSESSRFVPPTQTQIHLVGKEQIGNTCRIIANDTYQVSNYSGDWLPSRNATSDYNLPFSLPVSNNIPTSFQIYDQQEDFVCCRIFYTLEIKVSSMDQVVVQPIYFHKSNTVKCKSISMYSNDGEDEEDEQEEHIPKKLFWGITKQLNQRWQYEVEFPHIFNLGDCKSENISLRLRSLTGNKKETNECCLIGCQILQSIHLEGYQDYIRVLATATQLLTKPNKSWSKPCLVDFDLDEPILPTVNSQRVKVVHCIRVTVGFCNEICQSDSLDLDLQFPIAFTGYAVAKQIPITKSSFEEATAPTLVSSSTSLSSSSKTINIDSAIGKPFSYKSYYAEGEHRIPCFKYPLSVQG